VRITGAANSAGANPSAKAMTLVAAMCAGADSIAECAGAMCTTHSAWHVH
jgi:hypothetical protein